MLELARSMLTPEGLLFLVVSALRGLPAHAHLACVATSAMRHEFALHYARKPGRFDERYRIPEGS